MRISLKAIANQVNDDIQNNKDWFIREVSFVMDGSHNSGYRTREHIYNTVDTTKKTFGKRNINLIAYCGNKAMQDIYNINANQANSVWKYLPRDSQIAFTELVKDLLINIENEIK